MQQEKITLPIARPPWTKLGKKLESATRKALFEFDLLEEAKHVAVALSGGKDSLTLLYLLHAIKGKGFPDFTLHAIHVTGEFSCGSGISIDFLKGICKELDVALIIRESTQKRETLECYSCASERRRLLFKAAKEVGATTIAFGHHKDDSAQTLMMNLLHKGEFAALLPKVPMHKFGVTIIRPLIYISEQEIRNFAEKNGFARVTCRCPVGQNSMRKQVDGILDQLTRTFPNARGNIASAGLLYGSDKAKRI